MLLVPNVPATAGDAIFVCIGNRSVGVVVNDVAVGDSVVNSVVQPTG